MLAPLDLATFKPSKDAREAPAVSHTAPCAAAVLLDGHLSEYVVSFSLSHDSCIRGPGIGRGLFEGRTARDASEAT